MKQGRRNCEKGKASIINPNGPEGWCCVAGVGKIGSRWRWASEGLEWKEQELAGPEGWRQELAVPERLKRELEVWGECDFVDNDRRRWSPPNTSDRRLWLWLWPVSNDDYCRLVEPILSGWHWDHKASRLRGWNTAVVVLVRLDGHDGLPRDRRLLERDVVVGMERPIPASTRSNLTTTR